MDRGGEGDAKGIRYLPGQVARTSTIALTSEAVVSGIRAWPSSQGLCQMTCGCSLPSNINLLVPYCTQSQCSLRVVSWRARTARKRAGLATLAVHCHDGCSELRSEFTALRKTSTPRRVRLVYRHSAVGTVFDLRVLRSGWYLTAHAAGCQYVPVHQREDVRAAGGQK